MSNELKTIKSKSTKALELCNASSWTKRPKKIDNKIAHNW